jgi:protein tyrosine/serine phosphatase
MSGNRMRFRLLNVLAISLIGSLFYSPACVGNEQLNTVAAAASNHPWAAEINLPGVPNFHKVSEGLYRGAQPTKEGFKELKKLGIKTVVDLHLINSDRDKIKDANLNYKSIPMTAWHPEEQDVVKFLKIAADPNLTPVFVHCQRGADRTGMMCAIYRVAVQDWTKDEAIEEMTRGGFKFSSMWQNLIDFIRKLDVEKIRRQAGIGK